MSCIICWVLAEMQKEELNSWMERDLVAVLTAFFYKCDASHCKNKKVRTGSITCMSRFSTDIPTLYFFNPGGIATGMRSYLGSTEQMLGLSLS